MARVVQTVLFRLSQFLKECIQKMTYHSQNKEEVLQSLQSSQTHGLTSQQVAERQQQYGANKLNEKKKKTFLQRFLAQFKDAMILILIAAAIISFVVACVEGEPKEFFEPVLILLIVFINAFMGVMQESKAEKALDALKNMSAPLAKVLRDGKEDVIDASLLVPGDIIKLEAGDFIPADARLISSTSLKCEESALTGESVPSEKFADSTVAENAPLGDRENMVYSGCSVAYGTAFAVVTATGMNTEMGKIANLLDQEEETQTPLQQKLAQLGKYLGILALVACAIIFVVGVANQLQIMEVFMTAVSLAVSAIPEGLPAIVTIVLSIGVQRMVKRNAIIRKLPAVETLGSASVICSDKTGTLTQNRMTLVKAFVDGQEDIEAIGKNNTPAVQKLLTYGTLCSDGTVVFSDGKEQHIGDPTETAIVVAAHKNGLEKDALNASYPRLGGIPFDSDRKLMTTIHNIDGKLVAIVKGAFDVMKDRCIQGDFDKATQINEQMSTEALRVLAVGYKILEQMPTEVSSETVEKDLVFMGLVGMIDPPREDAKQAVAICKKAGIKAVMITGDHITTATAIAKQLGIFCDGDQAITGAELDLMTDSELDQRVESISVYARVSPENKIRIVKAWQRKGQIVSMTGDGVNDAPALKAADIGCAMGITGTDVAKGAADMTLTDDRFSTIVDAVREGRGIYSNIKKVVGYLLGTNIGEVICVFVCMILWHVSPLMSMQLLWINLVTDSLPAIALGMEDVEDDIMDNKPRAKTEGLFAHGYGLRIVLQGVLFGGLAIAAYVCGVTMTGGSMANLTEESMHAGQTLAFMVLGLSQVAHSFNMRSERSLFAIGPFSNKKLNGAALVSLVLTLVVMLTPINGIFGLTYLPWQCYLVGTGLVLAPVLVMEIVKLLGLTKNHK